MEYKCEILEMDLRLFFTVEAVPESCDQSHCEVLTCLDVVAR